VLFLLPTVPGTLKKKHTYMHNSKQQVTRTHVQVNSVLIHHSVVSFNQKHQTPSPKIPKPKHKTSTHSCASAQLKAEGVVTCYVMITCMMVIIKNH
jgi:hypothetical protein